MCLELGCLEFPAKSNSFTLNTVFLSFTIGYFKTPPSYIYIYIYFSFPLEFELAGFNSQYLVLWHSLGLKGNLRIPVNDKSLFG